MSALVSVLMTSYNAEAYVAQAIQSILNQTYTNWELLIADDCSSDNTKKIIANFQDPRIRTLHNEENLHYLRTRNKLIKYVQGEFITLQDADDWSEPDRLDKLLQAFERDPDLAMVGSCVAFVDIKGNKLSKTDHKPTKYRDILDRIGRENVFTGSTVMVRKRVWLEVGGYRDFFNSIGFEDYDLTSRIVEKFPAINLPDPLYIYRQLPESTSKKDLLYNPFKLHGDQLVRMFIEERKKGIPDSLERGDYPKILNYVMQLNRPFVDDPSRIYRGFMWSYLNRRMFGRAFKSCLKGIAIKPFKMANWKALVLYVLFRFGLIKK